ncbi:gamma-glutamyltransferase family protein [Candidatus Spongiihabitans sp.]|uniref:gamma-glutamyltransferase family protein n=1 Tax=Candidatus Spongiihabitans sp. TaxID=3101308 RepID=UPI003C7E7EEC
MPVMAKNMVATSQPLAVQAGLSIMRQGGNAIDAAIATAITLTVVEPTSNGIGSDAFCILWDGAQLHGLNASGRSPAAVSADDFAGRCEMPQRGWDSVTVPGAVSAWVALSSRFGRLPFGTLFESAIEYADHGFMVTPITAHAWAAAAQTFSAYEDFAPFLPGGSAPSAGQLFRFPDQARTLEKIADTKGEAFYRGELADKMVAAAKRADAKLAAADLEAHQADWVDLLTQKYNGFELHEIPPNGQGLSALIMLGILQHHNIAQYAMDSADSMHCQIEAMKLAFADAFRYIADPAYMDINAAALLDAGYLEGRAALIDMKKAGHPDYGLPPNSGTVYLAAADQSGMMASMIQSNYQGFGSGIVIPETGISVQNRAAGFVLQNGHPNQVGGGKRPFHTIIPAFVTANGAPFMSFGVMGGHMQAQGQAQMAVRICDYGLNPQAASDAPRWQVGDDNQVHIEQGIGDKVRGELKNRGHHLARNDADTPFSMGGAQLIVKTEDGYIGGSDHRKDGMAAGF